MKSRKKTNIKHPAKEKNQEKVEMDPKEVQEVPQEISETPKEEKEKKEGKLEVSKVKVEERSSLIMRIVVPAIIGAIVGIFTAGTVLMYFGNMGQNQQAQEPIPTVTVVPSPSQLVLPAEEEVLGEDLSLYDIKVLNGSGKAGVAGTLEDLLEKEGYSVLEIGNADNSNYEKTVIQAKEDVSEQYLENLQTFLAKTYVLDDLEELDSDSETDLVIIVGQDEVEKVSDTEEVKKE